MHKKVGVRPFSLFLLFHFFSFSLKLGVRPLSLFLPFHFFLFFSFSFFLFFFFFFSFFFKVGNRLRAWVHMKVGVRPFSLFSLRRPPLRGGCQARGVVVRCARLRCTRL